MTVFDLREAGCQARVLDLLVGNLVNIFIAEPSVLALVAWRVVLHKPESQHPWRFEIQGGLVDGPESCTAWSCSLLFHSDCPGSLIRAFSTQCKDRLKKELLWAEANETTKKLDI